MKFIHSRAGIVWQIDGDRLKAAMARAGLNQSQLAAAVGLKQPSIARLLTGETKTSRALDRIAAALETTPAYIKGETDLPDLPEALAIQTAFDIPQLTLSQVTFPPSFEGEDIERVPFPRAWLQPLAGNDLNQLFAVRAEGDQMMPTLLEGDLALVDRSQDQLVEQDRLFCLSYGGLAIMRRLRRHADSSLRLVADNPQIAPIAACEIEVGIIGRVVWVGRQV